jgi:hypothetical protein
MGSRRSNGEEGKMTDVIDKHNLTPDQQAMLAIWQQHAHAEFVLKGADAAPATMTENPHVFLVASGCGASPGAAIDAPDNKDNAIALRR